MDIQQLSPETALKLKTFIEQAEFNTTFNDKLILSIEPQLIIKFFEEYSYDEVDRWLDSDNVVVVLSKDNPDYKRMVESFDINLTDYDDEEEEIDEEELEFFEIRLYVNFLTQETIMYFTEYEG
jgi:ABC-type Fe3+-hydroxamate transport system substrate-binding protein